MYYYYNKRFLHDSLEIIPDRAIPLTDKEHSELFAAFARGYELSVGHAASTSSGVVAASTAALRSPPRCIVPFLCFMAPPA